MATRSPAGADFLLVCSDACNQKRCQLRALRGFALPEGSSPSDQRCGELRDSENRQDKTVVAETFPQTAADVEQAGVAQARPAHRPSSIGIVIARVVASAPQTCHAASVPHFCELRRMNWCARSLVIGLVLVVVRRFRRYFVRAQRAVLQR